MDTHHVGATITIDDRLPWANLFLPASGWGAAQLAKSDDGVNASAPTAFYDAQGNSFGMIWLAAPSGYRSVDAASFQWRDEMLLTIDRKPIHRVPHASDFASVLRRLGEQRADEVRVHLQGEIDRLPLDPKTGRRTFSSSHLGSKLSPWPKPLSHLYHVAREIEGERADEQAVQDRGALLFGLFIWECIMNRDEEWVVYDPNLSAHDPNREITGKVYFEQ